MAGEESDHVKGMAEANAMAAAGLALFKEEGPVEIDTDGATAFKAAEDAKMVALDEEIAKLTGKDNKKARTEKEKEKKAIKDGKQYIDAEKVIKGKEPQNGFFMKKQAAKEEAKPAAKAEEAAVEDKGKDKKDKPKKAAESTGISKAERDELEKLKNDIIARKKELKEGGMSGGQMNKDEQVVAMVTRMNELKEKECPGATAKKDDGEKKKGKALSTEQQAALADYEKEVEEYRTKLQTEFKYSKKEIAADPDMVDMLAKLKAMQGKK